MDIVSIEKTGWINSDGWTGWDVLSPSFFLVPEMRSSLNAYEVQKGEEMRLDLVMMSIYQDPYLLKHMDVILYINDIDNPLNIREGMILYYPNQTKLDDFRYYVAGKINDKQVSSKNIKQSLGVFNKTTRKDENRKKFLDADYSLPPTVMRESRPPVYASNGSIVVGGL